MCGIFAAIKTCDVSDHLISGLTSLSYRGYDSAGIAVKHDGLITRARAQGKVENLSSLLAVSPLSGSVGIAHTRWATHGLPNERNAHPHMTTKLALVHNGIVENYPELRCKLEAKGYFFETETDSESIALLITSYIDEGDTNEKALVRALGEIEGSFGLAIIFTDEEDALYAARRASPIVVGRAASGFFLSSDENALIGMAEEVLYINDSELVRMTRDNLYLTSMDGEVLTANFEKITEASANSGKGSYQHYMLKEIYEQPEVFERCWRAYFNKAEQQIALPTLPLAAQHITRLSLIACGTSYFAAMVAKYWIEKCAGIPVDLEIASEYRYRQAPVVANSLAVFISQSGETADTLAAMRYVKSMGQATLSLVNVINSTMAHESDASFPTLAGPEVGVASTKAFISQLTTLLMLAQALAKTNLRLSAQAEQDFIASLQSFGGVMAQCIETIDIDAPARFLADHNNALYLGRGSAYALAEEGALKLKEISYIHAEAYPAGELKHGPLALVDEHMPIVLVAPPDELASKTLSNLREVASRGGKIILISDRESIAACQDFIYDAIEMPCVSPELNVLLYTIPLQLLAYRTAVLRGNDVDQPRNLAKSVTVE